jgi:signal transduction histidine kinase/ligand-binding sensor domain-containing protein
MPASAAAERLPLRSYGTADGLPSTAVIHILRDTRGFLWFSTRDGLARFDGSRFVTYGTEHGLPVPTVNFMLESRRGGYWVATNGGGVCRLEEEVPLTGAGGALFRCLRVGSDDASNRVDRLLEDRTGRLWAASDGGLYALDDARARFDAVDLGVSDARERALNTLAEDAEGSLWIGGTEALLRRLPDGRVVRYRLGRPRELVRALLVDRDGRIWLGHRSSGLLVFRPEPAAEASRTASRVIMERAGGSDAAGEVELPVAAGEARWLGARHGAMDGPVYELLQSSEGHVWVAGQDGLSRFDGRRFHRYPASADLPGDVVALAEDRDGNLWIGGPSASLQMVRDGFVFVDDASGPGRDEVRALYESEAGELFAVSGDWRLSRFDGRRVTSAQPRVPRPQMGWMGQAAFLDRDGRWWILSPAGVGRLPAMRRFEDLDRGIPEVEYPLRDVLPGEGPFRLFEDARRDVWISVQAAGYAPLARWERSTERVQPQLEVRSRIAGDFPSAMDEDGRGALWVGFYRGGLGRLRGDRFELLEEGEHGAPRGVITALHVDAVGRLWVGSDQEGLSRVDEPASPSPRFVRYGVAQGLASNNVRCVTSDRDGRIYAGTAQGVDRLEPATGAIRHYTTRDGLPNAFVTVALRDRRGDLWFGTRTGLARLTPSPPGAPKAPPPVWIAEVRVGGVPQRVSHLGARALTGVVVPPDRSDIQIEFSGLGFAMGERLRYQYLLDGSDRDFGPLTAERVVHYARLSPGRHRFRVRAVNAEGASSPEPASVELTVVPALWQRGSVRGAVAALIALGLYAAHRRRLSQAVAVERVRMRIAADLHDEVGSSLSRVAILSEVVRREVGPTAGGAERRLAEIAGTSRALVDAMGDVVWSVDPRQDDLASVARRISEFAADVLAGQGMRFELHAPPDLERVRLDPERRRHLYLILKEAVHNAARHAAGRSLSLRIEVAEGVLTAEVADDGRGIRTASGDGEHPGHGLANMRARARQLGGELSIDSTPGGTRVRLRIPVRGSSDRMDMRLRERDRRARMGTP